MFHVNYSLDLSKIADDGSLLLQTKHRLFSPVKCKVNWSRRKSSYHCTSSDSMAVSINLSDFTSMCCSFSCDNLSFNSHHKNQYSWASCLALLANKDMVRGGIGICYSYINLPTWPCPKILFQKSNFSCCPVKTADLVSCASGAHI